MQAHNVKRMEGADLGDGTTDIHIFFEDGSVAMGNFYVDDNYGFTETWNRLLFSPTEELPRYAG